MNTEGIGPAHQHVEIWTYEHEGEWFWTWGCGCGVYCEPTKQSTSIPWDEIKSHVESLDTEAKPLSYPERNQCDSCVAPDIEGSEGEPLNECPKSMRPCGHHCNHSWSHDHCHWCGIEFGEEA